MISFLLGSGFSHADGVPLVNDINDKLLELSVEDIYITSDMNLILFDGKEKPARPNLHRVIHEHFIIELIQFYSLKYEFNYEELFDYVNIYSKKKETQAEIEKFYGSFIGEHEQFERMPDCGNLIYHFKIYYQQILSSILTIPAYQKDVGLGNYPPYDPFFNFINHLIEEENHEVKVHTLNHDLLFEHIASKLAGTWQKFTDGYAELGSPYYGEVNIEDDINENGIRKSYKIRLKYFTNTFDKPIALYKLHGSIDTYDFDIRDPDSVRIKTDYRVGRVMKEVYNDQEEAYAYIKSLSNLFPDFLTGTTAKLQRYEDTYYANLIDHFQQNLQNSDLLIAIGYGFNDSGINDLLWENYLCDQKDMVIIDKYEPEFPFDFSDNHIPNVITKEFQQVTYDEYLQLF